MRWKIRDCGVRVDLKYILWGRYARSGWLYRLGY